MKIYNNSTLIETDLEYIQKFIDKINICFSYIWVSNAQITLKIVTT